MRYSYSGDMVVVWFVWFTPSYSGHFATTKKQLNRSELER